MFDIIKEKKSLFWAIIALLVMLGLLAFFILFPSTQQVNTSDDQNPFGDTGTERASDYTTSEFLFGTSSEQWVTSNSESIGSASPKFRAISKLPVGGSTIIEKTTTEDTSSTEYVRYTSQSNGNIFETTLATVGEETLISNEKMLRIGRVDWSQNGNTTLTHYLDRDLENITSHLRSTLIAGGDSTDTGYLGRVLDEGIISSSISPDGSRVFYIKKVDMGTVGYIYNVETEKETAVWSSVLTNLTTTWNSKNIILVYNNPSSIAEGVVWMINATTGKSSVILSNELALAAKVNDVGTKILFSMQEEDNGLFSLRVLDIKKNTITQLPIGSMIEKCAWGPGDSSYVYCAIPRNEVSGSFIEDWYMGVKNSDDTIWRIDISTETKKELLDPYQETEETFDIEDLVVSPKEEYLVFRTRVNDILWALEIPQAEVGTE